MKSPHLPRAVARLSPSVTLTVLAVLLVIATLLQLGTRRTGAAAEPARGEIRVDQVGYVTGESKYAYLMAPSRSAGGDRYVVRDERGRAVLTGRVGPSTGHWNRAYPDVRVIDLGRLRREGTYTVDVTGSVAATSPAFSVAPRRQLLAPLIAGHVRFFQAQRDGQDIVASVPPRKPSHLNDRRATVYRTPRYSADGEALLDPGLVADGGPVDVSGGWFDAGDFLKFTQTTSYTVATMLLAQRAASHTPGLATEAGHGLDWLDKMWDERTGTLYAQVGIGVGNDAVRTDHDVWRLPEADDRLRAAPGEPDHTIGHRPVFRAAKPGAPLSPNLAGRMAAVFALAAQRDAADRPERARAWLSKAAGVYTQADTDPRGHLVTAFPHAFYPEDSWQDDLEFAAVELARAGSLLDDPRTDTWHGDAVRWARAYLRSDVRGTLGDADVSALAHTDLLRTAAEESRPVPREALLADLRRQVREGTRHAADDPFRVGGSYRDFDSVPHTLGLLATARLYTSVSGDHTYDAFATRQRDWVLGANPWGTSFVVGAGEIYPRCVEHQAANLTGGHPTEITGAVVNGPNAAELLEDLNSFPTMRPCRADAAGGVPFRRFDGHGARYLDDVGAWQTVEPADDFTATALLAFTTDLVRG